MFLINSRLGQFSAAPTKSGRLLSRSYETILPSSLATDHSSTFGYSPRLPVSVYGTGGVYLKLRGFSWKQAYSHYPLARRLAVLSGFSMSGGFTCQTYTYAFQRTIPSVRRLFTTSSPHRNIRQYRNIKLLSIDYALRLRLRSRLTLIRLALIRKP